MPLSQLQKLERAIKVVRKTDAVLPIQILAGLLVIARKPGCSQADVAEDLDTTASSAARICAHLSTWERPRKPGLGLVEVEVDVNDRRRRLLWLTPKGRALVSKVEEALK